MSLGRRDDRDRVAGRAELLEAAEGAAAVPAGDLGRAAAVDVVDARERRALELGIDARVMLAELADADDATTQTSPLMRLTALAEGICRATEPGVRLRSHLPPWSHYRSRAPAATSNRRHGFAHGRPRLDRLGPTSLSRCTDAKIRRDSPRA